jgi:hypothetical protein
MGFPHLLNYWQAGIRPVIHRTDHDNTLAVIDPRRGVIAVFDGLETEVLKSEN